jgi:Family of unknown function (DUF5670)
LYFPRIGSRFWYGYCFTNGKSNIMSSLLYIIAVILIIGWVLGFFVFSAGSIIHVLLVLAVIAILIRLIGGSRNPI